MLSVFLLMMYVQSYGGGFKYSAASNSNIYNGQLGLNIVGGVSPLLLWMNDEGEVLSNELSMDGVVQ